MYGAPRFLCLLGFRLSRWMALPAKDASFRIIHVPKRDMGHTSYLFLTVVPNKFLFLKRSWPMLRLWHTLSAPLVSCQRSPSPLFSCPSVLLRGRRASSPSLPCAP